MLPLFCQSHAVSHELSLEFPRQRPRTTSDSQRDAAHGVKWSSHHRGSATVAICLVFSDLIGVPDSIVKDMDTNLLQHACIDTNSVTAF